MNKPTYEELVEALRPFAGFTPQCFYDLRDDVVIYRNGHGCVTAGDFRRAQMMVFPGTHPGRDAWDDAEEDAMLAARAKDAGHGK